MLHYIHNCLTSYFNTLKVLGYVKPVEVNNLLVCCFLEELLTNDMSVFITEKDYRLITEALNCLYGTSCITPYPYSKGTTHIFSNSMNPNIIGAKITENSNIRITEDTILRFKASNYNE